MLRNYSAGFRVLTFGSQLLQVRVASSITASDADLVIHQALTLLNQKLYVLNTIKLEDYSRKVPEIYHSSVGSHLRHSLDHFNSLISAAKSQEHFANYDIRNRNTDVEYDPSVAKEAIEKLKTEIQSLDLYKSLEVSFIGDEKTFQAYKIKSTVMRELSFVSHHAVHHMSMIKLILQSLSYDLPSDSPLGIALSTAKDMKSKSSHI